MKFNNAALPFCVLLLALSEACNPLTEKVTSFTPQKSTVASVYASPTPKPSPTSTASPTPTSTPTPTPSPSPTATQSPGANVMTVTVNGSLCGSSAYANEPCVSVTICQPGTSNCQTINNILLDTGSYGLRLFESVITIPLTPVMSGSSNLAECVQYGDGSSQWGKVEYADVKLGGEGAVRAPIEVINSNYATPPSPCTSAQSTPDTSPSETGFNGILGVGLFNQDCGSYCASTASNGMYYACSGTSCAGAATSVQVQNPVALLPVDNNGVILKLPSISTSGATSVTGSLVLGIGTQSNNSTTGVTFFPADSSTGEFTTQFSAYSSSYLSSFIDSGSSILFIPSTSSLPDCSTSSGGSHGSGWSGIFCPSSTLSLTAVNRGTTGNTGSVSFQVGNGYSLMNSGNSVFMDLAGLSGTGSSATVDWGLPFFFGRSVFVGIEATQSPLGTGPYWAY